MWSLCMVYVCGGGWAIVWVIVYGICLWWRVCYCVVIVYGICLWWRVGYSVGNCVWYMSVVEGVLFCGHCVWYMGNWVDLFLADAWVPVRIKSRGRRVLSFAVIDECSINSINLDESDK